MSIAVSLLGNPLMHQAITMWCNRGTTGI